MKYDFSAIESKWQKYWDEHGTFRATEDRSKEKFYALVEFPYPSGSGMHVGHIKAYSGLEVVSRKRRLQGYNVKFLTGTDASSAVCQRNAGGVFSLTFWSQEWYRTSSSDGS